MHQKYNQRSIIEFDKNQIMVSSILRWTIAWAFILSVALSSPQQPSQLGNIKSETRIQEKAPQLLPYHVLPVYGNASLGYYYVNIYVGSPDSQPQSVIIDTGSGILAVPCSTCKSCGHKNHIHPPYNPFKSNSSRILTCESDHPICQDKCRFKQKTDNCSFSIHYAQGSTLEGTFVEDDLRLEMVGKDEQIKTVFGCTQKETRLFFEQKANGIFGLAPRRESNLLEELFNRHSPHNNEKKLFSLCLASNGGIMTVGGINPNLHPQKKQPDISVPFNDNNNLYSLVGVKEISIGPVFVTSIVDRIGGYGIFIDSGSTFSYIPENKYKEVEKLLNTSCFDSKKCEIGRGEDSICYKLNLSSTENLFTELNRIFPVVQININNKEIKWPPTKYMLLRNENKNQVCMGLQPLNRYLLGANWMYDRDIVFDLKQKMIHIYDNVTCVNNAGTMGQYTEDSLTNNPINYTNKPPVKWTINTNSTTFVLGIGCLLMACLIALMLCVANKLKNQRNQPQRVVMEEEDEEGAHSPTTTHPNPTSQDLSTGSNAASS